jgi:glycosyltransferase involved in cell wall biosynthesis
MLLSLVIPTHNRSLPLKRALSALKNFIGDTPDIEVHIIDDHSNEKHKLTNISICKKNEFNYHWLETNNGPAFARNIGIKASKGEWVAFLDDDVCIDSKWLNSFKNAVANTDEKTLGIEGATKSSGNSLWDSEVENLSGGLYLSCNIVYRREILIRLSGFDEQFKGPFAEDQELALRIKKWGDIVFEKELIVHHMPRVFKLTTYCAESFSRMRMLLDSEFYFYLKHRDRYHTVRYADTFWEELLLILFKHSISTMKRRTLKNILLHPVQAAALFISSLIEQLAAWLYLPLYVLRFTFYKPNLKGAGINWAKTKELWGVKKKVSPSVLQFSPHAFKSFSFRFKKAPVYNSEEIIRKTSMINNTSSARVFIRIDDIFFDDHDLVNRFCKNIKLNRIPFLAAVTGNDFLKKEHLSLIGNIVDAGGALALHGFSHNGKYGPYPSELLQMGFPQLENSVSSIFNATISDECKPIGFIPPFNAISWEQVVYLSRMFPIICGGPESIRFNHYLFGPVVLDNGAVYFPSCYPFYNLSANLINYQINKAIIKSHAPICITVHFPAEASDGFASLFKLIRGLKTIITDWHLLFKDYNKNPNRSAKALN